jgi:methylmalonyl-CoA mutase cobalamin-binding domain/chain
MLETDFCALFSAFSKLEYQQVRELVKRAVSSGTPANEILKAMQEGMIDVGEKYEHGQYFLSELMAAGEIFKSATEELTPYLAKSDTASIGTVVLGTVQGDLHDIGKNIFKVLLESAGFTVHDLGVDISPEHFANEVNKTDAAILAMSSLLTTTRDQMHVVIDELKKAGLRSKVKVIVGGNPITEDFGKEIGADAAVRDAILGERICKNWIKR